MKRVITVAMFPEGAVIKRIGSLVGAVVQVCFGGDNHIPGNPFPFVRILRVRRPQHTRHCPNCENIAAVFALDLEWEAIVEEEPSTPACEECITGKVVSGEEYVVFGDKPEDQPPVSVSMVFDLKNH